MTTDITAIIAEDEPILRAQLKAKLGKLWPELKILADVGDGEAALEAIAEHQPRLAFLDIQMPEMTGVEVAKSLAANREIKCHIVFVTAFDQYAVQAFELAALDYLDTPVRANRLADALKKARRHADESVRLEKSALAMRQNLSCLERGRILLVPVTEIAYLKAEQKYVTARTAEREYLLEESLVHLESEFSERFLRIHRNCLVARAAVTGVERAPDTGDTEAHWQVILDGVTDRLPVSRRQWPQVKALLKLQGH